MPVVQNLAAILIAYVLGCFTTAYYLVKLWKSQDIRQLGSGTVGGRNAGRVLGPAGFVIVAVGDALKGLLAVLLARWLGVSGWMLILVMLAVVAGHIWPVQLGFHGGKGAATMIGALVGYSLISAVIVLGLFLLLFALLRSFTLSGMLAFGLAPLVLLLMGQPMLTVGAVLALAVIVLIAHRANIRARLASRAAAP